MARLRLCHSRLICAGGRGKQRYAHWEIVQLALLFLIELRFTTVFLHPSIILWHTVERSGNGVFNAIDDEHSDNVDLEPSDMFEDW